MSRVIKCPRAAWNCRGRGTEEFTFGALRRLPVAVAAFLASRSPSVSQPRGD